MFEKPLQKVGCLVKVILLCGVLATLAALSLRLGRPLDELPPESGPDISPPITPAVELPGDGAPPPAVVSALKPPALPGRLEVGQRVRVARPGGSGHAHMCRDHASFAELQSVFTHNSFAKYRQMVDEGKVLQVANDTRADVMEVAADAGRIRLFDGEHAGRTGWVSVEYLQPTGEASTPPVGISR